MRKLVIGALILPLAVRAQNIRVTGVTFDSLSGRPLAAAFVTLGSKSTMADSAGRFAFDSILPGSYRVTMQHDVLDSLGLSGLATTVNVTDGRQSLFIATPSVMTMWRRVCRGEAPPDSGFVFGTVFDAATRKPVRNAPIAATWLDLRSTGRGVNAKELRLESTTIDDGSFVLCGVPLGVGVRLHSSRDSVVATSLDLLLSRASPVRRQDLSLADASLTARGVVRGSVVASGKGVPNARVVIGTMPEVRTAANGQFIVVGVPAGTQQIEVQGIGFSPAARILNVGVGDTLDVSFNVDKAVTLDSVVVRGSVARQALAAGFDERRRKGGGYFRDSLQLGKYLSLEGAFATMASVRTERVFGGGLRVVIGGSRSRGIRQSGGCQAVVIVDRMRTDFEHLNALRPSDLGGMEVYRAGEMPMDLATQFGFNPFNRPCAIVAWTKMGWK